MQNIEIELSDEDIQYFKDIESFPQSGCVCSLLHGKILISSFEVPIIKFRGLQDLSHPFRNDNFIQNVAQSGLSNYVQHKVYERVTIQKLNLPPSLFLFVKQRTGSYQGQNRPHLRCR